MARSVTGLFTDQQHVDRIVGALVDAGFDAAAVIVAAADGSVSTARGRTGTGAPRPASRDGIGVWLARHLELRGLAREHAQRYQARMFERRHLVSVAVDTAARDEEARYLMVDMGAKEISSAADGTMVLAQCSSAHGAIVLPLPPLRRRRQLLAPRARPRHL